MDKHIFVYSCCSIDLESTPNGEIFSIGATFKGNTLIRKAPFEIKKVLAELDSFAKDTTYLLGHNILHHDLPLCRAISKNFSFLSKPVVDTLYLSPIAFPENPYHRLVKNYKLIRDSLNNPLADARLAELLFQDQWQALQQQGTEVLSFYHYAFADNDQFAGLQQALLAIGAEPITASKAISLFKELVADKVCATAVDKVIISYLPDPLLRPALAYCLAWLRVAGGNSVLPPWVKLKFENVAPILRQLRDIPCNNLACNYCQETHNPVTQLKRFFGFPTFRAKPSAVDGSSLQQQIIQSAMCDTPIFAVLPTGGGKSLCYQLPALVRYLRRGVLTIVISPLQALMKDQVDNLRNKTGAPNTAALYGMLTAPERGEVLQAIQMGDIAILYVSPEQLRNVSFQKAIEQREIGCWVFDEAHCLSKWGHDFRPDYLYAARFIKEFAQQQKALLPPVQCFTATAKQDVKDEIVDYFRANLAQELTIFEGGVERNNLQFAVQMVTQNDKYARINQLLNERLSQDTGSAIIYCAKQKNTESVAEYLQQQNWQIEAFHAGKDTAEKKHIQENFISGSTRIITATNAFGMGIDKENVRLVIHADIPGSLENYLQEAGRAGRDQKDAECILLFDENDIDTQFKLSASSQINQRDVAQILKGLRTSKKDQYGNVVLTTGELLMDDHVETSFDNADYSADTKVKTAVSWLERAGFIQRDENRTQVFQGRPLVKNMAEAKKTIAKLGLSKKQEQRWSSIIEALFNAESDAGFSADELAQHSAFSEDKSETKSSMRKTTASLEVIRTLYDMAEAGLIQKNLLLTAYVRYKVANASTILLGKVCEMEFALIKALQEQAPDAEVGKWQQLSLRLINQHLLDAGFDQSNPEILRLLLASLSKDGLGLAGKKGSLTIKHKGQDQYSAKLNRSWKALQKTAQLRQTVAKITLDGIIQRIPDGTGPSSDLLIEFAAEDLLAVLKQDMVIQAEIKDPLAAVERALNFLHEQKIITLQKGLAVFRQAMTIRILPEAKGRRYSKGDFEPLSQHYSERVFQVHVINEYARQGLEKISHALSFVLAYFSLDKAEFVKRYFTDRKEILERAASQQSFQRIVNDLQNPQQAALVASHENQNLLILAGPGSGKTRVVIHRCAYLLRVKQVQPRNILVLCFNRNAVTELRYRLIDLVGDDAKGMTIQTYHGLSLRLTGHALSPESTGQKNREQYFATIIKEATQLLQGEISLLGVETDEIRDRLLAGFRYILVDEYQDIDAEQYQLISAIAGRTLDEDSKLTLLAVGDDDQNIYQFRGTNVGFIRQFEDDYQASMHYLVENYRSSAHIIAAANQLIQHNHDRMKLQHPIRINQGRKNLEPGGRWQKLDTLSKGRVQKISIDNEQEQAFATIAELLRLRQLDNRLKWSQCAILAKEWGLLSPVRALLEAEQIPFSIMLPADRQPPPFRIRENADLLDAIKQHPEPLGRASDWINYLDTKYSNIAKNPWLEQLKAILQDWQTETNDSEVAQLQTLEFLHETLAEQRRERRLGNGVFLSTIHSVKGMEFSHIFILDGGWTTPASEEQRRLYYVAMTRAKETLCLLHRQDQNNPLLNEMSGNAILQRSASVKQQDHPVPNYKYVVLGLQDFDLSYAGSFSPSHLVHQRIADINLNTQLDIENKNHKVILKYGEMTVAILSKNANQEWLSKIDQIKSVAVLAMIRRYRSDNDEDYQSRCKVDQWEVPFLEVAYTE